MNSSFYECHCIISGTNSLLQVGEHATEYDGNTHMYGPVKYCNNCVFLGAQKLLDIHCIYSPQWLGHQQLQLLQIYYTMTLIYKINVDKEHFDCWCL